MNQILLCSSIISSCIHIYFIPNFCIIHLGLLSSILNHLFTNEIFKLFDRVLMIFIIFTNFDFYYIFPIIFYLFGKFLNSTYIHLISHISLTIIHIKGSL
jgi:hypothetical protein